MKKYDHIVVGSGIGGLTAALLLAIQGRSVLLIEKAPRIGGSIARFRRKGIPFDVGFHFTGGLSDKGYGMMADMLKVMGIKDDVTPVFYPIDCVHEIALPSLGETHTIPAGVNNYREQLKDEFPAEREGLDIFFDRLLYVCEETGSMYISRLGESMRILKEDHVTLQEVLDELINDQALKAMLSAFCMCHGSRPTEISFADHSRVSFGMYDSTARVKDGGDGFIAAFENAFKKHDVEIRCGTTIKKLDNVNDRQVGRFVLSDGDEVSAESCILAIHPFAILELLTEEHTTPAFRKRVGGFEPSNGFFSIFGSINSDIQSMNDNYPVFSIFPDIDMDRMMSYQPDAERPVVMIRACEEANGGYQLTMTAFEVCFHEDVERWKDSRTGRRGEDYLRYKEEHARAMIERLGAYHPALPGDFNLLATASMLTYRDYLYSPFGEAYGIKQKAGQFNLLGRLPLVNCHAAGQSSLLPGVAGAMTSGFFVVRGLLGKQVFQQFIEKRL